MFKVVVRINKKKPIIVRTNFKQQKITKVLSYDLIHKIWSVKNK